MSSGVFVVRQIAEDTMFKTAAGKEFLMRAGDRVAIYPPATHKDEEIFTDPLVSTLNTFFKFTVVVLRLLEASETRNKTCR